MKLTDKNFCPYVKNASTALRMVYLCKKTNKICPKVEYDSGNALPSRSFIKNGCPLNEVEETKVEEIIIEKKEEVAEAIEKIVVEAIEVTETIVEEEMKENKIQEIKPKTTNKKRKTNKKK